jgi:hypothetical protein
MRRNLKRYYGAGDLHFITCSCYRRQPWLGTARRRDLFLTVVEQVRKRYQFVVVVREVAHPPVFRSLLRGKPALHFPVEMAHPPRKVGHRQLFRSLLKTNPRHISTIRVAYPPR